MKIVPQSVVLEDMTPSAALLIERAARNCYKSEGKVCPGSAAAIIKKVMNPDDPHHSVLEHAKATVRIITDRGIMAEITRHRHASFSIESTRYCNYGKDAFGAEITVVQPPGLEGRSFRIWRMVMRVAEWGYMGMLRLGVKPEIARSVLPMALKTEIVMTANFSSWHHILKMRTNPRAHPQVREVMEMVRTILQEGCPEVFGAPVEKAA